jgi:NAD(P)H-hydrate epimerase
MTGSVSLSAHSAMRTGCGMVHCALPESIIPIVSVKVTEPVLHSLKETDEGTLALNNIDIIKKLSENMQAALIGPGISHNKDTGSLVRELLSTISIPTVLDADGINVFKEYTEALKDHAAKLIITPHYREWERLFGILPEKPNDIINTVRKKAKEYSMVIVLKGNPTIIADSEGKTFILPVGNSGMASAGSGDVLSGIIVSLIAQGCIPLNASILGVAIHGLAGEKAGLDLGEHSMTASDIILYINSIIKQLLTDSPYSIISLWRQNFLRY